MVDQQEDFMSLTARWNFSPTQENNDVGLSFPTKQKYQFNNAL